MKGPRDGLLPTTDASAEARSLGAQKKGQLLNNFAISAAPGALGWQSETTRAAAPFVDAVAPWYAFVPPLAATFARSAEPPSSDELSSACV